MANYLEILKELEDEQERIGEAILVVRRLASTSMVKRKGRPPAWLSELKKGPQTAKRGRPFGSKNRPKEANAA